MAEKTHTPTPWQWATSNSWRRLMAVGGQDGDVLCPTVSRSDGHPDLNVSEADMAFILRAVNAHDDLLAVISRYLNFKQCEHCAAGEMCEDCADAYAGIHLQADAAIAKATE